MNNKQTKTTENNANTNARYLFEALTIPKIKTPVYIFERLEDSTLFDLNTCAFELENIFSALNEDKKIFNERIPKDAAPVIILSKPGNAKAKIICNTLRKAGVIAFFQDPTQPFEIITETDKAKVKELLSKNYSANNSAGGCISDFENVIESSANTPAIKTGFSILDKVLDGGLYEGIYSIGAISSLGKTTFCLNIAEQIAAAGTDVIIIALEMSKYQLMSKSISRLTFCRHINNPEAVPVEWCKTSRGISNGSRYKKYNPDELNLIKAAREYYAENIGQHIFIYEAIGNLTASTIRDIVARHVDYTDNKPVVIVDYLQLVKNDDARINANDKTRTDYNLTELKQLSRDYKLPIMLISSVNRGSYKEEIKFESFKESGGIDFGSDVIIGLQLAGVGTIDFNVNEAKAKNPREIEAVILKNREAPVGDIVKYLYYPMFNHFEESAEDVKAAREYDKEQAKAIKEKEKANRAELAKIEHNELINAAFEACAVNGTALITEMVEYCGGKPTYKTLEKWIKESGNYKLMGNKVNKIK